MQFELKRFRNDILIVLGFAVLSLLFCYPQLQGKKLVQSDNVSWQGITHEPMSYHDSTGKDVLWSNNLFGGMPTYTFYVGATNTNYVSYIQSVLEMVGKPAYFFFIAMIGFYILSRAFGVNKWLGAVGAVAYAFSSYNAIIISVGHETKMLALGYFPAALAGLYMLFKEKWLSGAAVFGLFVALLFTTGHYQIIYYAFIVFLCFGIAMFFVAIKHNRVKQFFIAAVIAVVVGAIGIGPSFTSVLTTQEYTKHTMRGGASELSGHDVGKKNGGLDKDYAFMWSMGISETFCAMVPYLYGGATYEPADMAPKTAEATNGSAEMLPIYWGDQPYQAGPVYFGAAICFLFVLGLILVRSPHKWWILAASIIGIVLAWGKNLPDVNYFLFDHIPMLNKFRTVEMALVIPELLFPLLAVLAVHELIIEKNAANSWKSVKIAAGITAGLCVLLGVGGSMFFNFTGHSDAQLQPELVKLLRDDRASLAMSSGLKSAAFILVTAALLWAFIKDKINKTILFAGLGIVFAVDLMSVSHNYLKDTNYADASDYDDQFKPRPVDLAILKDQDPYFRVFDLSRDPYNDATQCYFFKCVGGYSPAKMEIYQDLIDHQLSKGFNAQVLNMLNTKYIITPAQKAPPQVIPNPQACGNAWFVDEVKWANTADDEMNGLNAARLGDTSAVPNAFEPKKTAVMRTTFKDAMGNYAFGKDSAAYVKLAQYGLDDLSFTSSNSKDGLAVFSDIYYEDGWKAFVDGKETPIMKADYVLRAIKVPQGKHNIEFHFHPDSFYKGRTVSIITSILLLGLCCAALVLFFRKEEPAVATTK
jgi:hypothetical protein